MRFCCRTKVSLTLARWFDDAMSTQKSDSIWSFVSRCWSGCQ